MAETKLQKPHYEVWTMVTQSRYAYVISALSISQIKVEVGGYGKKTVEKLGAYLSVPKCRLLIHKVLDPIMPPAHGFKYESIGGSVREGNVESRILKFEFDEGQNGSFAKMPWRIVIGIGEGKQTETGAIAPLGKPSNIADIRLTQDDMLSMVLELQAHLNHRQQAYERSRYDQQLERFESRHSTTTDQ